MGESTLTTLLAPAIGGAGAQREGVTTLLLCVHPSKRKLALTQQENATIVQAEAAKATQLAATLTALRAQEARQFAQEEAAIKGGTSARVVAGHDIEKGLLAPGASRSDDAPSLFERGR